MQWFFLILALVAALVELHTGTFYLAGVAAAASVTTVLGFWIRDEWLILVFLLLCAVVLAAISVARRLSARRQTVVDFDVGQSVSVHSVLPQGNRWLVRYRGTNWEAVMDDGTLPAPGDSAIIARRTDKLLHLISPPKVTQA